MREITGIKNSKKQCYETIEWIDYYYDNLDVCQILASSSEVQAYTTICGLGHKWTSYIDDDMPMLPGGNTQIIYDVDSDREIFRVQWIQKSTAVIVIGDTYITVAEEEHKYIFYYKGKFVAFINERENNYLDVDIEEKLGSEIILAILSFPLLGLIF